MKRKKMTLISIGPHRVTYVPLRILAPFALPARAWKLAPGLCIHRLSGWIKDDLFAKESMCKPSLGVNPNYTINIDSIAYGNHIRCKLANEGKTIPHVPKDLDAVGHEALNITKMILIGFFLQKNLTFTFANAHSYEVLPSGVYNKNNTGLIFHTKEESSRVWQHFSPSRLRNSINRRELSDTIDSIEPYYRPFTWELNRVSTALCYFWSAVVAKEPNQLFTNLTILLECLLGTWKQDLTHKISERAAIILGKNSDERLTKYDDVRSIYKQRSRIVHGEGVPKKGATDLNKLFMISAKHVICPRNIMTKVIRISIDLLNALLRDDEYIRIIRSSKSEEKKNDQLNALFMKRLFH